MKRRIYKYWNCEGYDFSPYRNMWMEEFFQINVSALHILKARYANGEISKEEFEKMKKDIS